jgi:macrolide transport system ATP-binding/permease protein
VTGALRAVDSRILMPRASTLRGHFGDRLERARLAGVILSALALLLSVLGIYGVVSFAASRRQREVGIRMALGAGRDSVVRLFIRDVAGVVIGGAVVGLGVSLPAGRFIGQEFTGAAGSPWLLVLLAAGLVGTALLAPAMRAANTDPRDTLCQE